MEHATLQFVEFKDRPNAHIRAHAMPRNAVSPVDVLRRWTFLSEQFPRFLGALGCSDAEILRGGDSAVEFWSAWWAAAY